MRRLRLGEDKTEDGSVLAGSHVVSLINLSNAYQRRAVSEKELRAEVSECYAYAIQQNGALRKDRLREPKYGAYLYDN